MRICALVDPAHRTEIVSLVQELVDAAGIEAVEDHERIRARATAGPPHDDADAASQSAEQGPAGRDRPAPASRPTSDATDVRPDNAPPSVGPPGQASIHSAPSAAESATTSLSQESVGSATGGAVPLAEPEPSSTAAAPKSDGAAADDSGTPADGSGAVEQASQSASESPRGTSDEPAPQRHAASVRTLAEIPAEERDRIYARWLDSRKANGGKCPATELEAIAEDFNTTARVVYNFCYGRLNNPPKGNGNGANKVAAPKVSATTVANDEAAGRQKALAALKPPAPRVTRMRGSYGGGE